MRADRLGWSVLIAGAGIRLRLMSGGICFETPSPDGSHLRQHLYRGCRTTPRGSNVAQMDGRLWQRHSGHRQPAIGGNRGAPSLVGRLKAQGLQKIALGNLFTVGAFSALPGFINTLPPAKIGPGFVVLIVVRQFTGHEGMIEILAENAVFFFVKGQAPFQQFHFDDQLVYFHAVLQATCTKFQNRITSDIMLASKVPDCKPFVRCNGQGNSDDYKDVAVGYIHDITDFPLGRDEVPGFGPFRTPHVFHGFSDLKSDLPLVVRDLLVIGMV
jgi:hypothetical protein